MLHTLCSRLHIVSYVILCTWSHIVKKVTHCSLDYILCTRFAMAICHIVHLGFRGELTMIERLSVTENVHVSHAHEMSHIVRKPTICICENKGADQL